MFARRCDTRHDDMRGKDSRLRSLFKLAADVANDVRKACAQCHIPL
jgi:hypothetical protein